MGGRASNAWEQSRVGQVGLRAGKVSEVALDIQTASRHGCLAISLNYILASCHSHLTGEEAEAHAIK